MSAPPRIDMSPRLRQVLTGLLLLSLLASALWLVHARQVQRTLHTELHALQEERDQLNREWTQLLLEEAALAAYPRIDRLARAQQDMREPDGADIRPVRLAPSGGGR